MCFTIKSNKVRQKISNQKTQDLNSMTASNAQKRYFLDFPVSGELIILRSVFLKFCIDIVRISQLGSSSINKLVLHSKELNPTSGGEVLRNRQL